MLNGLSRAYKKSQDGGEIPARWWHWVIVLLAMWAEIIAIGICVVFLFIAPLIFAINVYVIWCMSVAVVAVTVDDDYLVDESRTSWRAMIYAASRIVWLSLRLPRFLYQHFCKPNHDKLKDVSNGG
jgi:hypothetical protein